MLQELDGSLKPWPCGFSAMGLTPIFKVVFQLVKCCFLRAETGRTGKLLFEARLS